MEKELTPLRALIEMYQVCLIANVADMSPEFELVKKALKALEVIKKRECLFKGLSETTQEEYDLLKEVVK